MLTKFELEKEFDYQVNTLLQKKFHDAANLSEDEFLSLIEPLKEKVLRLELPAIDLDKGYLPFIIVISPSLLSIEKQMSLVEREGKPGITKLFPRTSEDFKNIESVPIIPQKVHVLVDIDRGKEFLNIIPEDALKTIQSRDRSPLTIEEGVGIVIHHPEFLMKNNCFSLLASRYEGDQRVPAIWINTNKNPNLGWCWDRNPHTWLGSASCKSKFM